MRLRILLSLFAVFALFATAAAPASAGYKPPRERYEKWHGDEDYKAPRRKGSTRRRPCKRDCDGAYRYVYAESWYGFKKVVAPVRQARLGEQVRLPGGTWVYCEFSCEYTLRKQSLDFWESQGNGSFVSPGLFRKDFYLDERW